MSLPVFEVAPVAPAAGALAAFFFAVLAFIVVTTLLVMWVQILRKPLIALTRISIARIHPFGFLRAVVTSVDNWLDSTQKGTERAVTWALHSLMWSLSTAYTMTRDLAEAVYHAHVTFRHRAVKTVGAKMPATFAPRIRTLEREYKGIDQRLDRVERRERAKRGAGAAAGAQDFSLLSRGIDRLRRRVDGLARDVHGIEHAQTNTGAKTKTGTHAIPNTKPRVIPRTKAPARHWTDVLTKAAAGALVIAALGRIGLGWLRCPSLLRMGRRMGCSGFGWLESFFAATFEALVVLDLCRFALAAQSLAKVLVPQLAGTLLVQNAVCLGGGASYPSAHDSPKVQTKIALPSAHD